jgi:WhiB family redox-sensing transcriptional regulator
MSALEERAAKEVCQRCPVRLACLDDALTYREPSGVWGGLTSKQRQRLVQAAKGNLATALMIESRR